jgi:DNA-binding response OmpR family regulator
MNEQLLLVEDDDAIADALRIHLEQAGYRLHREADGLRAIGAIDRQRWDLVLLDLMLPGADGWDVCRHLRARHADVPVIMLSARSTEAHRVLGLAGADDSPSRFHVLGLVARSGRCCGASIHAPGAVSLCAHVRGLSTGCHRHVLNGDQPVPLTA